MKQPSDPIPSTDGGASGHRPEHPVRQLVLSIGLASFTFLGCLEGMYHLIPERLPIWFTKKFPAGGIEFKEPGLLDELPIEASAERWFAKNYTGQPPGDLSFQVGIVDPADNPDPSRYPIIHFRVDEDFLSNPKRLERADVLLVGDSFGNAVSALTPPGLQSRLAEETGLAVYNISEPGAGPPQQKWMLRNHGLSKKPSAVIWFFFDGNDLLDGNIQTVARNAGYLTWASVPRHRRPPTWFLPTMLKFWSRQQWPASSEQTYLPGFDFVLADGSTIPFWFHPIHLDALSHPEEWWRSMPGYPDSLEAIRRARRMTEDAGARFLFLFVPCKTHVLISRVERDAELAHRMASHMQRRISESDPEEFLKSLLLNRGVQEQLMREFCESEGIEFLSARRFLEELADEGEPGYFSADTHWSPAGHGTLVEPLAEWLRGEAE